MQRFTLIFCFLCLSMNFLSAQTVMIDGKECFYVPSIIVDGDTLPYFSMREVTILPPRVFKNKKDYNRYKRLVHNIKRTYPYSQIAKRKLIEIESHLATLETEQEKKKYINKADKELREEFEGELKNLTISQGRVLIKLIDRETGATTYYLVEQLKGSFSAFLWQSLATLFGSNLKSEFDAEGEDALIEEILIRIENGEL